QVVIARGKRRSHHRFTARVIVVRAPLHYVQERLLPIDGENHLYRRRRGPIALVKGLSLLRRERAAPTSAPSGAGWLVRNLRTSQVGISPSEFVFGIDRKVAHAEERSTHRVRKHLPGRGTIVLALLGLDLHQHAGLQGEGFTEDGYSGN